MDKRIIQIMPTVQLYSVLALDLLSHPFRGNARLIQKTFRDKSLDDAIIR